MIIAKVKFTFIDKSLGVNKDGERYFVINVISKDTKKKFSFVAKKPEVLDKIINLKFVDFQDVELILDFDKIFNPGTRYSNWNCELIGIGSIGNN